MIVLSFQGVLLGSSTIGAERSRCLGLFFTGNGDGPIGFALSIFSMNTGSILGITIKKAFEVGNTLRREGSVFKGYPPHQPK
jgi:hypothetical protein